MTFFEAGKLLEEGKKIRNNDKRYWGDNFLYIQYVDETTINNDLNGNEINQITSRKIMLNESNQGFIEYILQHEDFLSNKWEEYIEKDEKDEKDEEQ